MALGAEPAGLGARDTLRLEAGMPLYGHELTAERNGGESGFARAIARDKAFIGSDVVCDAARRSQALVGLRLEGRRAARAGALLCDASGAGAGIVTSGSYGPSVGSAVALGYVDIPLAEPDTALTIRTERGEMEGRVAVLPFWKDGTVRKRIEGFLEAR